MSTSVKRVIFFFFDIYTEPLEGRGPPLSSRSSSPGPVPGVVREGVNAEAERPCSPRRHSQASGASLGGG